MITEVVGSDLEKLKGEFEYFLNILNMCGMIDNSAYCEGYNFGTDLIQKAYELGKKEGKELAQVGAVVRKIRTTKEEEE